MCLDAVGENPFDRFLARTSIGPWPLLHTRFGYKRGRVIMAGTRALT